MKCNMCGKSAKSLVKRWYVYNSGEQCIAFVCETCAELHATLTMKVSA